VVVVELNVGRLDGTPAKVSHEAFAICWSVKGW
jgi:hypothetical protein